MADYRQLHIKIWCDEDFLGLSPNAKLLFIYLFSNSHRNETCLYSIAFRTITNETTMPIDGIKLAMVELEAKGMAAYCDETKQVLVINAVKYQTYKNNRTIESIIKTVNSSASPKLNNLFVRKHSNETWYRFYLAGCRQEKRQPIELKEITNTVGEQCSNTVISNTISNSNTLSTSTLSLEGGLGETFLSGPIRMDGFTLKEVTLEFHVQGIINSDEPEKCFNYYDGVEWFRNGTKITKLKPVVANWIKNMKMYAGKPNGKTPQQPTTEEEHKAGW